MPVVVSLHAEGEGLRKARAERLALRAGHGAVGDRHAGRDPDRALLVASSVTYRELAERGLDLPYGSLGENVIVDGLRPERLAPGTRLRAGTVRLEVAGLCTVCRSLSEIDPRLPKLVHRRRGVYVRVLEDGAVREGDPLEVLAASEEEAHLPSPTGHDDAT